MRHLSCAKLVFDQLAFSFIHHEVPRLREQPDIVLAETYAAVAHYHAGLRDIRHFHMVLVGTAVAGAS